MAKGARNRAIRRRALEIRGERATQRDAKSIARFIRRNFAKNGHTTVYIEPPAAQRASKNRLLFRFKVAPSIKSKIRRR